jgi:hypothetical protein
MKIEKFKKSKELRSNPHPKNFQNKLYNVKIETNVLHMGDLFSLYTWELNFEQIIWDKSELLLGTFWKQLGNLGNPMGIHKEHDGNTKKKKKQKIPTPQPLISPC